MAPEKIEGPSPVLTFAGIELDCSRHEARLPHKKVEKRQFAWEEESYTERAPISYWLNEFCMLGGNSRESFPSEADQSYIGIKHSHHFIRLTSEAKKDLRLWETFMSSFNGKSFFLEDDWATSKIEWLGS